MNHGSPSGPTIMSSMFVLPLVVVGTRVTVPPVVILPMFAPHLNHRFPSGPLTIPPGEHPPDIGYSVTAPEVVPLPILLVVYSVNQRLPSGPVVMVLPPMPVDGSVYSVMTPVL